MATLPASSDITSSTATEGAAKTWFASVRTFIAQMLGTDGTQTAALQALGSAMNSSVIKSGAYTVVAADRGKVIKCTGTWTLAFSAASTLGDGFNVEVANDGAGVITIDPNLSEQIDGATTLTLAAGKSLVVYCDGSKFITFGRGGVETFNTRSGAVTLTSGDVTTALGFTPPTGTATNVVGSFVLAQKQNAGAIGATIGTNYTASGSLITIDSGATINVGFAVNGTWKCLGFSLGGQDGGGWYYPVGLFMRVA